MSRENSVGIMPDGKASSKSRIARRHVDKENKTTTTSGNIKGEQVGGYENSGRRKIWPRGIQVRSRKIIYRATTCIF